MPNFDGTGPCNQGPMTGRGLGPCGAGRGFGKGYGRGWGRGFGRGWRFRQAPVAPVYPERTVPVYKEPTKKEQKDMLKAEKAQIEKELKEINQRLQELK
ncbi:hypothetical protein GF374_02380 [Candidatus Woesearchaeota archaeon]|nr:hypothetical protein [Candidatus Woesearchaeota archaeon]